MGLEAPFGYVAGIICGFISICSIAMIVILSLVIFACTRRPHEKKSDQGYDKVIIRKH